MNIINKESHRESISVYAFYYACFLYLCFCYCFLISIVYVHPHIYVFDMIFFQELDLVYTRNIYFYFYYTLRPSRVCTYPFTYSTFIFAILNSI